MHGDEHAQSDNTDEEEDRQDEIDDEAHLPARVTSLPGIQTIHSSMFMVFAASTDLKCAVGRFFFFFVFFLLFLPFFPFGLLMSLRCDTTDFESEVTVDRDDRGGALPVICESVCGFFEFIDSAITKIFINSTINNR